jgi:hypothetical protein
MAQFPGDIAFLLEMVLVAGGLVLLRRAVHDELMEAFRPTSSCIASGSLLRHGPSRPRPCRGVDTSMGFTPT